MEAQHYPGGFGASTSQVERGGKRRGSDSALASEGISRDVFKRPVWSCEEF